MNPAYCIKTPGRFLVSYILDKADFDESNLGEVQQSGPQHPWDVRA
jgi:hypothetical protein